VIFTAGGRKHGIGVSVAGKIVLAETVESCKFIPNTFA